MNERTRAFLLLTPALAVIGVLFLGSLVTGLMRSFNYMPSIGLFDPNLDAFRQVLMSIDFYRSLSQTLYISLTATVLASCLALLATLLLRRMSVGKSIALFLFQLNLAVPHSVGAVGILYLFSQSGVFARLAASTGAIVTPSGFPALVNDPYSFAIIFEYVWKEVPFISLILLAKLQSIAEDFESVARTLGATGYQATRYVMFPMILPALTGAALVVFAFTFGAFEVPLLLGANYPPVLPVYAYRAFTDVDLQARPLAMAVTTLITVMSVIAIVLSRNFTKRLMRP